MQQPKPSAATPSVCLQSAGTFVESQSTILPLGVNILGAGQGPTIITTNGSILIPSYVDPNNSAYDTWYYGSLIQLYSRAYTGNSQDAYGDGVYGTPANMIPASNGNQTLSGFSLDGHNKAIKVGIWSENRNNVTLANISFTNFLQGGAVVGKSDEFYYLTYQPVGQWVTGIVLHDLTFTNSGSINGNVEYGNLRLAGLEGGLVYNININDNGGEGIKFMWLGYFQNTFIHDVVSNVPQT